MTELQAAPIAGTAPISTILDVGAGSTSVGGGAPPADKQPPAPPAKAETPADTMRAELARQREEEAKEADKVKDQGDEAAKAAKAKLDDAEKAPKDGKAAEPDKDQPDAKAKEPAEGAEKSAAEKPATEREAEKSRQSEGAKRTEPPARFLPKAKEAWINVPHSVREDVHRMQDEHEAEVTKYKAATERYEQVRQYDELAQKNGRNLKDSLAKVVQIETALAQNPIAGLDMILREIGPRKADGSPVSLYDIAQHIARQTPQQFHQTQQQQREQQQAQQREQEQTGEVHQLRAEIQNIRSEQAAQTIIAPFAASHPRYQELQEDIAFFLKSGKIPASLSPVERLEAAYDMAERINPASTSPALQTVDASVAAKTAPADDAGSKSVRGAPTGGSDPDDDGGDVTDIKELLRREARKLAS